MTSQNAQNIYWLASYPKSGNTWMRAFLSNYFADGDEPVDINDMKFAPSIELRSWFDQTLGIDSGLLTPEELDAARPTVYQEIAGRIDTTARFWKIHDAFQLLADGIPFFPKSITGGVIYIVRSPFDVAISYAHHSAISIDEAIVVMNDPEHGLFTNRFDQAHFVHQHIGRWSDHVTGWLDQEELRVLLVRYEDLLALPEETFSKVLEFMYVKTDFTRLQKAIRFSSFDVLKNQEKHRGFNERSQTNTTFFRQGKSGGWRNILNAEQMEKIRNDQYNVIKRLSYLHIEDTQT